jgi:hypothetical protein
MGSPRTRPSTFTSFGRFSARAKTSSGVHTCYVASTVDISACLHSSCNGRMSWNTDEQCAFRDFHFSSDDIHSEHMLSHESQFHVQRNPPLIPKDFTERSLP